MSFQRARSDSQINDRIDEIISVASDIYNTSGYEGVNFSAISELTEFTRPTIYKYFSAKEEILLHILTKDIDTWIKELTSSFKLNTLYTAKEISEIWAKVLASQKRMNELHSILFTILEKNSSKEAIIQFKKKLFSNGAELYKLLCQLFPKASAEQITDFITLQYSLAVGYYPMCYLTEKQIDAIKSINNDYVSPDFEKGYQKAIYLIMLSLESANTN